MPIQLIRQYATWRAPQTLSVPECSKEAQLALLVILDDPHLNAYPPSRRYRQQFWKRMVEELETRADEEIDERIYETCLSYMHSPAPTAPSFVVPGPEAAYKTHFYPLPDSLALRRPTDSQSPKPDDGLWGRITVFESPSLIESGTTGLRTWRASLLMAEWLLLHPETVRHRKVLELGSGTGFLGIVIAQVQLPTSDGELWMTDVSPSVLERCWSNVHLPPNKLQLHSGLQVVSLDWTSSRDELREQLDGIQPDILIGTDIVYDQAVIPGLVTLLSLALQHAQEAWIASALRNVDTLQAFLREAENAGLLVQDLPWNLVEQQRAFLGGDEAGEGSGDVKLMKITRGPQ